MQEPSFRELEDRASQTERLDIAAKLEARCRVEREVRAMIAEGRAFELTDEEERMIRAFRRFKLRMRKNGEVFRWQTAKPDGIILAAETAEVLDPNEATK